MKRATESISKYIEPWVDRLPPRVKNTFILRAFGFLQVPLLFSVDPEVVEISNERCVVRIPLKRRTKNHLNSMYFGALSIGADCAGGLMAMRFIRGQDNPKKESISLIFKDFHADFLKRAEGDVFFTCEDGLAIRELVKKALGTGERQNLPVQVVATVPSQLGNEPVARFTLTLSLKKKSP